jgi:hypothetical protein
MSNSQSPIALRATSKIDGQFPGPPWALASFLFRGLWNSEVKWFGKEINPKWLQHLTWWSRGSIVTEILFEDSRPQILGFYMSGPATCLYMPNNEAWWRAEKGCLLQSSGHAVRRDRVSIQIIFRHLRIQTWAIGLTRQRITKLHSWTVPVTAVAW